MSDEKEKEERIPKEERNADSSLAFTVRFWVVFYSIFALDCFFSALLLLSSLMKIFNPSWEIPSWFFFLIFLMSAGFIASAFFCSRLIISVAQLIRYARNQEHTAKGVIGARDINQYIVNEEKRNEEVSTLFREGWSQIGQDVRKMQGQISQSEVMLKEQVALAVKNQFQGLSEQVGISLKTMAEQIGILTDRIQKENSAGTPEPDTEIRSTEEDNPVPVSEAEEEEEDRTRDAMQKKLDSFARAKEMESGEDDDTAPYPVEEDEYGNY